MTRLIKLPTKWIIFLSTLFLIQFAESQTELKFYNLGVDQGLSQNSVSCITQDKFGFMWFGTASGLNRYDGYEFKIYQFDPKDSLSLSESAITALFVTNNGDILVATRHGGFNRFNKSTGKVERYTNFPKNSKSISSNSVNCVIETKRGVVFAGTDKGLNIYNGSAFVKKTIKEKQGEKVTALFEDNTGKIWVGGASNTITQYNFQKDEFVVFTDPDITARNYITKSIKEFAPGILMLATTRGLRFFDTYSKRFVNCLIEYNNPDLLLSHEITSFTKDKLGNVWCAVSISQSENKIVKINPFEKNVEYVIKTEVTQSSAAQEKILSMYTDASGLVWMGTDGKGTAYFNPYGSKFSTIKNGQKELNQLTNEYVYAIEEDTDGSFWIGTNDFELHQYFPATGKMKYFSTGVIQRNWCSDIEKSVYNKGKIWLSFRKKDDEGGVILFDEKTGQYKTLDELSGKINCLGTYIVRVIKEEGNLLWVGTQERGLFCFNQTTKELIAFNNKNGDPNSLPNDEVADIFRDSKKRLWIATRGGLGILNEKTKQFINFKHLTSNPNSLSANNVLSFLEDSRKNIWVCTSHGLNLYNERKNNFKLFSVSDGLPDNFIYGALEDSKGKLWISTNNGLSVFNIKDSSFKNYSASDGLQSNEFNTHAFHKGKKGLMYFGGINGLNYFYPDSITKKTFSPTILLTSFTVLGKKLDLDSFIHVKKRIILNHDESFLSFDFASLDFFHPDKNILACKLEGIDKDWIYFNKKHGISYSNLVPGSYRLFINGTNSDGDWSDRSNPIEIVILPPFYKTNWFYAVCLFTVLMLIRFIYRYRVRKLIKARNELELQVQERTQEVVEQKNELNRSYDNIKLLSEIGKKITSTLELNELGRVVYKELNFLLDAEIFSIGIFNASTKTIEYISSIEKGNDFEIPPVLIDEANCFSSQCLKKGKEYIINDVSVWNKNQSIELANIVGNDKSQALVYIPILNSQGTTQGVFTVQSSRKNAYSNYHINLLRNLSVYINIAIENARAFKVLNEARTELEKLSLVASRTDNGVVICDEKGNIEWLNDGFSRLYGYNLEEFINTFDRNILKASNSSKISKILKECFETKRTVVYESKANTKDGKDMWVQTTLTPILDLNKNIHKLIAIDTDITELKIAEEQILRQKNEIEAKNKDITDSINYARRIQKATLATKTQLEETFSDNFVFFRPKDIVSGDFYWMSKNENGKVFMAIADCTGHGVPGAILSVIGTALLDEIIIQQKIENPAEALEKMRKEIIRLLNPDGAEEETNDGIDIVLCAIDFGGADNKIKMEFACAKNPLVLIRNGELKEFTPDYFCVGKDQNYEKPFNLHRIEVEKGDKIYIYSDGYADQFGGEKGKKFKAKNLQELLLSTSNLSMSEQHSVLVDAHERWKGDYAQVDDVCVVGACF